LNTTFPFAKARSITLAALLVFSTLGLQATPASDDASLDRGGVEDATPQQRYRSAIREAGGAYKESQRECAVLTGTERPACLREAKQTYDRDMADARRLLNT
jgi:hypothetical protein